MTSKKQQLARSVFAALTLALPCSITMAAQQMPHNQCKGWPHGNQVKCYGVVKAGQNGCRNVNHSCGGKAKKDRLPNEWIALPKGVCQKIDGASLKPKNKA